MMQVRTNYAVICDDIRREDNGKLIYIGVYGRDIQVSSMPATLALSVALSLTVDEAGEINLEFAWEYEGKTISRGKGQIAMAEPGVGMINIPALPIPDLKEPGKLEFKVRFDDKDWETVSVLPVINRGPIASGPPV